MIAEDEPTEPTEPEEQTPAAGAPQPTEDATIRAELKYVNGLTMIAGGDVINVLDTQGIIGQLLQEALRNKKPERVPLPPDAPTIERVREWFEDLPDDSQKCHAITLAIFHGLKYADFLDLRERMVTGLGLDQTDDKQAAPTLFKRSQLECWHKQVQTVRAGDGLESVVRFKDEEYVAALYELLRTEYQPVLIKMLPVLRDIAAENRYWEIRVAAAEAVGEIGRFAFQRMHDEVLKAWAADPRDYVRATPGYPLRRLAEDTAYRTRVLAVLDEWTKGGRALRGPAWRYRWAAASAYKQIGAIDAPWASPAAVEGLRQLAGYGHLRSYEGAAVVDAVIHSLLVHSLGGQTEMNNVLLALKQWLEQGSQGDRPESPPQNRCRTAIMALVVIADIHLALAAEIRDGHGQAEDMPVTNLFDLIRDGEVNGDDFWQLLVVAGVRAFEFDQAPAFYGLIERWAAEAPDDIMLRRAVVNLLVEVYGTLRPGQQPRLWRRLNEWAGQERRPELRECATRAKDKILRGERPGARGNIIFGD